MSDENPAASGNRWEPTDQPGQPKDRPARAPLRTRARTAVAGGAAAVLLAGGLGGFAIGRATAGGDGQNGFDRQGVPAGFDRDGEGGGMGPGPGTGPGQLPQGQPPSDGVEDSRQDDGSDGTNT